MTITLKPWATIAVVAVFGLLVGLAIGQLTPAQSSTINQMVAQQKQTNRLLNQQNSQITELRADVESLESRTKLIQNNVYWVCQAQQTSVPSRCQLIDR